ncbi:MAG TPA: endonuclease/exonuclease/phosphatase family protein [Candidatus Limnocylindrales bacterium]|nr:endonuclease/exonuclease/phosphatase family protein [Candidatus Limnocylindrales bacterium]
MPVAGQILVMTWNIRAAIGPGPFPDRWWSRIDPDRLAAIGSFIAGVDADLIALQEVALLSRDGDLVDNAGDLARQLGMQVRFGAVRTFEVVEDGATVGVGCFGNALLSRTGFRSSRTVALPAAPEDALVEPAGSGHRLAGVRFADAPPTVHEPRCLLLAEVAGLLVGSTHFSHIGSGERLLQARATADAFADASPAVLLGDLNASIESPELAPLRSWTDGFAAAVDDAARISTDDGMRIDQVLARGASVSDCQVLRDAGGLSDHYPVVAEIEPRAAHD